MARTNTTRRNKSEVRCSLSAEKGLLRLLAKGLTRGNERWIFSSFFFEIYIRNIYWWYWKYQRISLIKNLKLFPRVSISSNLFEITFEFYQYMLNISLDSLYIRININIIVNFIYIHRLFVNKNTNFLINITHKKVLKKVEFSSTLE